MAITGTFLADFASFNAAVDGANVKLTSFETGGAKVERQLARMTDAFSGRKIIQDATLMAEVFTRAENGARLTAAELQRMGTVGEAALQKLHAASLPVPPQLEAMVNAARHAAPSLTDMGAAAGGAAHPVTDLHESLANVDHVLAAMDVHIIPEVRALGDLGKAAGKTVSEIGGVSIAGLALGAGIGGWKLGRLAADFFETDAAIGNATAKLLGWGSAADEAAGATADLLAAASRRIGHEVTDLSEAIEINNLAQKDWRSNAVISATAVDAWHAQIAAVKESGDLASLKTDLDSQNFSLQSLADRYHTSVEALQLFTRETAAAAAAEKAASDSIQVSNARKLKEIGEELTAHKAAREVEKGRVLESTKIWNEYDALRVASSGTATDKQIADIQRWAADLTATAVKEGKDSKAFYDGVAAVSKEKISEIGSDWTNLVAQSTEGQQARIDALVADYDRMISSGKTFTREVLDAQITKIREATEAMHGYGAAAVKAAEDAAAARKKAHDDFMKLPDHPKDKVESYTQQFDTVNDVLNAQGLTPAIKDALIANITAKSKAAVPRATSPSSPLTPSASAGGPFVGSTAAGSGGGGMVNHFYVNGSADDVARKVVDVLTKDQRLKRLMGGH